MKIKNISFITPIKPTTNIVLEKKYSQQFTLSNGSRIDLASDIGLRDEQQDSIAITENNGYLLLLVADGVGGAQKGEEASYNVAKIIKRWLEIQSSKSLSELNEMNLEEIITDIIVDMRDKMLPPSGGTTLNMSIIGPEETLIVNIGDSRTYSVKNNEMKLRTRDDSLGFRIFRPTTKEERDQLRFYKKNNVITNAICKEQLPVVVVSTINNDDYDILCHMTDGISDILTEDNIKKYLLTEEPAVSLVDQAISSEVEYTNTKGQDYYDFIYPHDNASAVVYTKKRKKNN